MGGRVRHIVTDCLGLLLVVAVTAANIGDRNAATGLLQRLRRLHRDGFASLPASWVNLRCEFSVLNRVGSGRCLVQRCEKRTVHDG
ncbi:hypothetical protein GCM10010095_85150 [Streptomyces anthocyanicus]|nr:hypothetical protein GCM10010095_85150 [Streptomyces anthocyanicus]